MRVAGVVLASGTSTRFGGTNKLLAAVAGQTVIRRTVRAYLEAGLSPVVVVVGHDRERVEGALESLPVDITFNPDFLEGQSRALRHGVAWLPCDVDAAVIGVGDQPLLTAEAVRRVAARFGEGGARLVVPRYAGRRGNPALFDRALFPELLAVTGDVGGRPVLEAHRDEIVWVDIEDARARLDIDTQDDLENLDAQQRPGRVDP